MGGEVGGAPAGASEVVSVQDILQVAQRVLNESLVRKVDAVYQFQLHGEGGGVYFLNLKHSEYGNFCVLMIVVIMMTMMISLWALCRSSVVKGRWHVFFESEVW